MACRGRRSYVSCCGGPVRLKMRLAMRRRCCCWAVQRVQGRSRRRSRSSGRSGATAMTKTTTGWSGCSMSDAATELERFRCFASSVGLELEPFQDDVMGAVLSDRREVVISQPRGAGKTTLLGAYALWELIQHPEATIICAAAARDQAQHLFRAAERFAKRVPALRKRLTFTMREIRTPHAGRLLVVSADSEKQMGHDPYVVIVDELGSHKDESLYVSLRSALIKNREARMRVIST